MEWRTGRDRGEGPVSYLLVLLVLASIAFSLVLIGYPGKTAGYVQAAICRVLEAGGLGPCAVPGGDQGGLARDPDQPTQPCLAHVESRYLEETLTIPTKRIDVRTSSRGTLQLNKRVGPDGKPVWEVVDFTWGELGVATPELAGGPVKGGLWGGGLITNGTIYGGFTSEKEARKFFEDLYDHRLGNDVKFTLRTNPISGGFVWLGTKLPWVGDDFDRYMGGSEPDREPTGGYTDGGLTGGFKADLTLWRLKIPLKGRGWVIDGTQTNYQTGERTTYYTQRGEFEAAVQLDVGDIIKRLPPSVRKRAQQGLEDGLDAVMNLIEQQLKGQYGRDFMLPVDQRTQMKAAIKVNPSIGFNYKHRGGTTWGVTEDKNGNIVRLNQTQNGQDIVYARVDATAEAQNGAGDQGKATYGKQWILFARRTITDKNLDYSSAEDRAIIDQYLRDGDTDAVERAWDQGAGTMGRMVFDNTGDTAKFEAKGGSGDTGKGKRRWGIFELGEENETATLTGAQYFKPGAGWVDWGTCR